MFPFLLSATLEIPKAPSLIFSIYHVRGTNSSYRWLIRHGRNEEALAAVGKISRNDPNSGYTIEGQTILMIATNNSEKASSGVTKGDKVGYRQAFNKSNIRRTEIACALWAIQNLCGPALLQFSAEFLVTAGVSEKTSFLIQIAQVSKSFMQVFIY
jgi:SP family general alpha glucoside:H+ symporter-like MFS transporter